MPRTSTSLITFRNGEPQGERAPSRRSAMRGFLAVGTASCAAAERGDRCGYGAATAGDPRPALPDSGRGPPGFLCAGLYITNSWLSEFRPAGVAEVMTASRSFVAVWTGRLADGLLGSGRGRRRLVMAAAARAAITAM